MATAMATREPDSPYSNGMFLEALFDQNSSFAGSQTAMEIKQEPRALLDNRHTPLLNNKLSTKLPNVEVTVEPRSETETETASEPIEFPSALKTLLEKWHEQKGKEKPPCRYRYRKKQGVTKAYNQEGEEVKMTEFSVSSPAAYGVLVAQYPDKSVKLVASVFQCCQKHGSYYRAWSGLEKGFEPEASIVRHFGNPNNPDVTYNPEAWPALRELLDKSKPKQDQLTASERTIGASRVLRKRKRTAVQTSARVPRAKRRLANEEEDTSSDPEETVSSNEEDTDEEETDEEETDEEETDEEETDEEETDEEETDEKKVENENEKVDQEPSFVSRKSNESKAHLSVKPELTFQLTFFKFQVQNVRRFPVDECKTGKDLFEKATDFFSIFDPSIQVEILSCQIASRSEQHYIFARSEGEFNLLLQQAQEFAAGLSNPLIIEVGLVTKGN
jgi:hypothetical protein